MQTIAGYHPRQKLFENHNTVILRGEHAATGKTVLLKLLKGEHPNNERINRLRREYSLLSSFDTPSIIQTYGLEKHQNSLVIVLEDCLDRFDLLSQVIRQDPFSLEQILEIGAEITQALAIVHDSNIIHRNCNPASILISKDRRSIKFIDFRFATEEDAPGQRNRDAVLPDVIIPYISPEQTGRIEQSVDYRSDLYSLGVTLFQLATGILPFTSTNIGELIHAHLARKPPSPDSLNRTLPQIVSAIILRLLEKIPDRRYQTCHGLLHDLKQCLQQIQGKGEVSMFPLGRHDAFQTLELPDPLSNRDKDLRLLESKLAEAACGKLVTVCISGEDGIGKSSLVQTFTGRLTRETTYCLTARFESTATPHSPLASVVRQLVRLILSEERETINHRASRLLQSLGNEVSALTAAFPETEQLLGSHGAAPLLDQAESEYRLYRVLGKFLRICCATGPVVVLFLDDLHYAEATQLSLLHHILSSAQIDCLLFLGAFRKHDAALNGPLQNFLRALTVTNPHVHRLPLGPLQLPEIAELLSTILIRNRREIGELAARCFEKTGGNPYYLRQFLAAANRNGHIIFSHAAQRWEWDIAGINTSLLTRNRAEAVKKKIPALTAATNELLRTAAALGDSCSLELVAAILGHHPEREMAQLFREGLMFTAEDEKTLAPTLNFAHARIREEALLPLSLDERSAIRLRAGRHLLHTLSPEEYDLRLKEIAGYFTGNDVRLVASRTERLEIARVQLDAGKQKMVGENYPGAHQSFLTGIAALPGDSWETDHNLAVLLHTETCESGLLIGDIVAIDRSFHEVCANVTDHSDLFRIYRLRIKSLKAQGKPEKAVATAVAILKLMGTPLPDTPSQPQCLVPLITTWLRLLPYTDERLTTLPAMTDPLSLATIGFLREAATAAYTCKPTLLPFLAAHAIRLTLRHGQCQESYLIGYLAYGFLLCGLSARTINEGYRFGQLALHYENTVTKTVKPNQAMFAYYNFICHWKGHIRDTLPPLRQAMHDHFEKSNLESTAHTAFFVCARHYLIGTNLSRLATRIDEHLELVRSLDQQVAGLRLGLIGAAVAALRGNTADPAIFSGKYFDETTELQRCLHTGDHTTRGIAMVLKLAHAVLFQDNARALRFSDQARPYLKNLTASAFLPIFYFYDSLARLALYQEQGPMERLRTRLTVSRQQRRMKGWARLAPQNYAHKYLLVEAESKRVLSQGERAMELYDNAIHLAHEHQYTNEEALAYEFAARFYNDRKKTHIARLYLREARYCYYRWGASAKINRLDNNDLDSSVLLPWRETPTSLALGEGASRLDMLTVIKASRILSSEMILDELLMKMMRIMLESGGAQKGALIFKEDGEWLIKVWGNTSRKAIITLTRVPVNTQNIAPTSIINYVAHTQKEVVLDDACKDGGFTNDGYVLAHRPRAILCMPIVHQGEIFSILYLENNLAPGTFPPDRQELLQLLGVQSAISLKNALLFEELERTVDKLNEEIEKGQNTQRQLLHAEKLSALGRLSASIAHEFGNPLMGVKYLLDDFHKRAGINPGDRKLLELGLEECDRMRALIGDLQRLNKPSSGKKSRTDIHPLIEHVLLFQKKHFSANRIKLQTAFDSDLPQVEIIVDQITQVLFNLTMNAVDAMAKDGGILTIITRRNENDMVIEIGDTGIGITDEDREQIFEPFFSTKKEEDGTGLGLSISYGIAHHHGGSLSFVSQPGNGTIFTLTLPLPLENQEAATPENIRN